MTSSGMLFIHSFMRIHHLIKKLLQRTDTWTKLVQAILNKQRRLPMYHWHRLLQSPKW